MDDRNIKFTKEIIIQACRDITAHVDSLLDGLDGSGHLNELAITINFAKGEEEYPTIDIVKGYSMMPTFTEKMETILKGDI